MSVSDHLSAQPSYVSYTAFLYILTVDAVLVEQKQDVEIRAEFTRLGRSESCTSKICGISLDTIGYIENIEAGIRPTVDEAIRIVPVEICAVSCYGYSS